MLSETQRIGGWFLVIGIADLTIQLLIKDKWYKVCFPYWAPPVWMYRLVVICFHILEVYACNIIQHKLAPWTWELNVYMIYLAVSVLWAFMFFYMLYSLVAFALLFIEVTLIWVVLASFAQYSHTAFWLILPCAIFSVFNIGINLYVALYREKIISRIPNPSSSSKKKDENV
jgi:tryptophan-rich sensory protein